MFENAVVRLPERSKPSSRNFLLLFVIMDSVFLNEISLLTIV